MTQKCEAIDAENLIKCFCLCNDMRVAYNSKSSQEAIYDGASQDELLLVLLAQESNFYELRKRDQHTITLLDKRKNQLIAYQIVRNIAFTVERKMQTMVVKDPGNGNLYVFTKGADEVIFPLLQAEQN